MRQHTEDDKFRAKVTLYFPFTAGCAREKGIGAFFADLGCGGDAGEVQELEDGDGGKRAGKCALEVNVDGVGGEGARWVTR